jgi:hypothetical protein
MERFKKYLLLIMMVVGLLLLVGCSKLSLDFFNGSEDDNGSVITLAPSEEQKDNTTYKEITGDDNSTESELEAETTPTPTDIQPTANVDLQLYSVNVDSGEIEAVTALVPADVMITPELIVEKVVESMVDRSIEVGIESVTIDGDAVIVSFYKEKAPLSEMGSGYEGAILDAIAQSLIDNLEDYNKVIYRAEGEAYVSGHFEFELNDVYLEDN